jgi:hypothetical protein
MYTEHVSNKNRYSGSFYVKDPILKQFISVLKWAKARNLPCFIFIMLCFKMEVATPGPAVDSKFSHGLEF